MPDWLPIVLLLLILCIAARILRKLSATDEHTTAHLDRKVRHLETHVEGVTFVEEPAPEPPVEAPAEPTE